MSYSDKILIELSKHIDSKIYLGPKSVGRLVRKKSIRTYDILVDSDAHIPENLIYSRVSENKYYIRLQGEKISVYIMNMDIKAYLLSRAITLQSITYEIIDGTIASKNIIDPLSNLEDTKQGFIGFNKNVDIVLRPRSILKIVEYMSSNKLKLEDHTISQIRSNSYLVDNINKDIVKDILFNILDCRKSHYYINYMDESLDILRFIFPEIIPMKDVGKCKYHVVDTWTHSINTMREIENIIYADGYFEKHLKRAYELHTGTIIGAHDRIKLMKLGALFHDIGKPKAKWTDENGRNRFRGHEIIGGEIVEEIGKRLSFNLEEIDYLKKLVVNHMVTLVLYKTNDVSANSLFDVFEKLGEDTMDIILIGLADIISTRRLLKPYEEMSIYKIHAEYLVNNYLIRYRRLLGLNELISKEDIEKVIGCSNNDIDKHMRELRKAIFNGDIDMDELKIKEFLKNKE